MAAVEREGVDFYSRAAKVASDPRAKDIFVLLARDKAETLRLLRARARTPEAQAGARVVPRTPEVYPRAAIEPLVCFVCGEEVGGPEVPPECPRCGASAYAFQVDIDRAAALHMAIESQRRSIDLVVKTQRSVSDAKAKEVLRRVANLERAALKGLEAEQRKPHG